MTYRDPEKQKEANRLKQARHRQKVTPSERDVTPSARPQAPDVTPRINPMNGKPYGTAMLGLPEWALREYERSQRPEVLKVREMGREQVDFLYRVLANSYGKRGE